MATRRHDETVKIGRPQRAAAGVLIVCSGPFRGQRLGVEERPLIVGSDPAVDLHIDDPTVSRHHCQIWADGTGVRVRDLESRNGTYVDGLAVSEAILRDGVAIRLGQSDLRYVSAEHELDGEGDLRDSFGGLTSASPAMHRVFGVLARYAASDLTITLIGETGTGKDVLARALHRESTRAAGPFVVLDNAAVAPTLIEGKLFGHMRGSFTGAFADQKGCFELADHGTLFLDEIGELGLELQPKLLRVLEQRTVCRIGGSDERPVDVRIVAATNRDLESEVAEGRFREDLFFRMSTVVVRVPPLRDRKEDIPLLLEAMAPDLPRPVTLAADALALLQSHNWPGNVRELKNVLLGAIAGCDSDVLETRDFVLFRNRHRRATLDDLPLAGRPLETIELTAIRQTLERCGGNKTQAARALGIATSTLYEKIKKYGL